jgi:hypothetical protein
LKSGDKAIRAGRRAIGLSGFLAAPFTLWAFQRTAGFRRLED